MKLSGQISRTYKDKGYFKHWIILPNHLVDKLGWKVGDDLDADIKDDKLIIEKD